MAQKDSETALSILREPLERISDSMAEYNLEKISQIFFKKANSEEDLEEKIAAIDLRGGYKAIEESWRQSIEFGVGEKWILWSKIFKETMENFTKGIKTSLSTFEKQFFSSKNDKFLEGDIRIFHQFLT